jgi:hypothetical protein
MIVNVLVVVIVNTSIIFQTLIIDVVNIMNMIYMTHMEVFVMIMRRLKDE